MPQMVWIKTTETYCLTVWMLEVQNAGVGRTVLPLRPARAGFLLLPSSHWFVGSLWCALLPATSLQFLHLHPVQPSYVSLSLDGHLLIRMLVILA